MMSLRSILAQAVPRSRGPSSLRLCEAQTMAKAKTSYVTGEKGRNRVRVFADSKTGILCLEFYEQALGSSGPKRKTVSTGHRDWDRAKRQADEMAARITRNEPAPSPGLTLRTLFDIYLKERTPEKSTSKQKHDHRCAE